MRRLSIFGATGSIGTSTFDLLADLQDDFILDTITAHNNVDGLLKRALEFQPALVVIGNPEHYRAVRDALPSQIDVAAGREAILEAASRPVDWMLNAIIGAAGLDVSMRAVGNAGVIALANKESIVAGGALLPNACRNAETTLLPVDSEHSAIFQSLLGQDRGALSDITLTASGGPFRQFSLDQMRAVTVEQALDHPNWDMGARITIDSASMFNKALEMIEAKYLFDLMANQINVLIHPQSIIHSMISFKDGGQMAQLGVPDMRQPIAFALGYPRRLKTSVARLDLAKLAQLDFELPDQIRFPALRLAHQAMEIGGPMGAVLNAAKEIALDRFLQREIAFLDMAVIVEEVMNHPIWAREFAPSGDVTLEIVHAADDKARQLAQLANKSF